MTAPLLELEGVSKHFGATRALDGVDFDVRPGEVHVLAGENGAGKTTLIRILSGAETSHTGRLRWEGRPLRLRSPADAVRTGIATIHQELSLVGCLSVADNLALARPGRAFGLVSRRALAAAARDALALVQLELAPERRVETLTLAQQQLLEIARALALRARVLVLDEPTSALQEAEAVRLFERMARLREQGVGIVYISHRLEEIYKVADRITVLRDGRVVTTCPVGALAPQALVSAMVGRDLAPAEVAPRRPGAEHVLGGPLRVRAGEILGLFGLLGSGAHELLEAAFEPPRAAIRRGVVRLASDRHESVLPALSVRHNVTLSSLAHFSHLGWVDAAAEREAVGRAAARLRLQAPSLEAAASELSGGNQQKVALARCLLCDPQVLLLDDPTRGIDIGAKADVHALLRELAGRGVAIVLVATELEELIALCDRVVVLAQGRPVATFPRAELSRERILAAAMEAA